MVQAMKTTLGPVPVGYGRFWHLYIARPQTQLADGRTPIVLDARPAIILFGPSPYPPDEIPRAIPVDSDGWGDACQIGSWMMQPTVEMIAAEVKEYELWMWRRGMGRGDV